MQLKDASGTVIDTQQTDGDGNYLFTDLAAGEYSIGVIKPVGFGLTVQDAVGNGADEVDSDVDVTTMMTDTIVLGEGEENRSVDIGLVELPPPATASVGDRVWVDIDRDGIQGEFDYGLEGVTVQLKDGNGVVLQTQQTDADGNYLFTDLVAGEYAIGIVDHQGFDITTQDAGDDTADSDIDPSTLMTETFFLNEGEENLTLDAGLVHDCEIVLPPISNTINIATGLNQNQNHISSGTGFNINSVDLGEGTIVGIDDSYWEAKVDSLFGITGVRRDAKITLTGYGDGNSIYSVRLTHFNIANDDESLLNDLHDEPIHVGIQMERPDGTVETVQVCYDLTNFNPVRPAFGVWRVGTTPIALDLNGDGEIGVTGETSSFQKDHDAEIGRTVQFDIDADGTLDEIEWFDGSGDGILIDNQDGNAANDMNGSRLFGDEGGKYVNGYEKLALLDSDGDGALTGDELVGLDVWLDDGDAIVEAGEIQSLSDHDIVAISTQMELVADDDGKALMQSSATTGSGEEILSEDVWFARK